MNRVCAIDQVRSCLDLGRPYVLALEECDDELVAMLSLERAADGFCNDLGGRVVVRAEEALRKLTACTASKCWWSRPVAGCE